MGSIIIIGGGHNALVCAFYLAKAGHKPIVLERQGAVGGAAITDALAPGYRCPTLAHVLGPLNAGVARDAQLERRGVRFVEPDPRLVALTADGRALVFSRDESTTAGAIRAFSSADAAKYPEFCAALRTLGHFLGGLFDMTPPSIDAPSTSEMWELLKTGRRFRSLGKRDGYRLLRWGPMAVADLVSEWFETDVLQAAVAARGVFGTAMGPWSAGTGAVLLLNAVTDPIPGGSSVTAIGGPGAVTRALADAAREAGAEIRTGAEVTRILVRDGAASGVVLADGTELASRAVISGADPKRTFLGLLDPIDLDPGFVTRIRNYRTPGTAAKVNLAVGALPEFRGVAAAELRGRIHIGPGIDYLERAFDASKYGGISPAPYLDVTIPSLTDPSLAPAGRHVVSVHVQYAPYALRGSTWDAERERLGDSVVQTLEEFAPGISRLVEHRQVITPLDLERTFGLTGGHIFHGELALDQLFTMRPTLGWSQYRTPVAHLYLCGSSTHPGTGLNGLSGRNAAREIARYLRKASA